MSKKLPTTLEEAGFRHIVTIGEDGSIVHEKYGIPIIEADDSDEEGRRELTKRYEQKTAKTNTKKKEDSIQVAIDDGFVDSFSKISINENKENKVSLVNNTSKIGGTYIELCASSEEDKVDVDAFSRKIVVIEKPNTDDYVKAKLAYEREKSALSAERELLMKERADFEKELAAYKERQNAAVTTTAATTATKHDEIFVFEEKEPVTTAAVETAEEVFSKVISISVTGDYKNFDHQALGQLIKSKGFVYAKYVTLDTTYLICAGTIKEKNQQVVRAKSYGIPIKDVQFLSSLLDLEEGTLL